MSNDTATTHTGTHQTVPTIQCGELCPACGSRDTYLVPARVGQTVHECGQCGRIFDEPMRPVELVSEDGPESAVSPCRHEPVEFAHEIGDKPIRGAVKVQVGPCVWRLVAPRHVDDVQDLPGGGLRLVFDSGGDLELSAAAAAKYLRDVAALNAEQEERQPWPVARTVREEEQASELKALEAELTALRTLETAARLMIDHEHGSGTLAPWWKWEVLIKALDGLTAFRGAANAVPATMPGPAQADSSAGGPDWQRDERARELDRR